MGLTGYDRYVITLDNGQVWTQSETNTRQILAPGDTVTIKRAALALQAGRATQRLLASQAPQMTGSAAHPSCNQDPAGR